MGWMCSRIIVCAFFIGDCALARRVNIDMFIFCSIALHTCNNHTGGLSAFSKEIIRCGCALELLAGRVCLMSFYKIVRCC